MRPKIICHMISSIDGRLLVDRWSKPARGNEALLNHYDDVGERFEADGWIAGRRTMSSLLDPVGEMAAGDAPVSRETYIGDRNGRGLAVILDPGGKLNYESDDLYGEHVVTVLSSRVPDRYLNALRDLGISYLFAGEDGRDLEQAMTALCELFGAKTLLLQGGGIVNGAMLKAGLIDEFSILISPAVDGLAGVPAIIDYPGQQGEKPAEGMSLRLIAHEVLAGGMVWLRYAVERS